MHPVVVDDEETYLTIVRSSVDRASLWNVIITLVAGRSFR